MSTGGDNKRISLLSTFSRFSDLAVELRIQIWQQAATANRAIPVTINHHPVVITHSCLPLLGHFCGEHSYCPSYNPDSGQPSPNLVCMFNGYFSLPTNTPDIDDSAARNLSLVCTESRGVVLLQYPEMMAVYRKPCFIDNETQQRRQVRYNPATDTLLVKEVPSYSSQQRHPSPSLSNPEDIYHEDLEKWFPQNSDAFASFRFSISRFQRVEFSFLSDFQAPKPLLFSGAFHCTQFQQFLIFFERLKYLYLCSDAEYVTAVREWIRVDDIEDRYKDAMENPDLQNFVGVSRCILNCRNGYNDYVRAQSQISGDTGECCWVPSPKGFRESWLFSSKDMLGE